MLASLIIVFREMLEASLVIGVLLAATRGLAGRGRYVALGCAFGVLGAVIIAFFTEAISNAIEGVGQEVFNAAVLLLASVMIGWHVIWMKHHAAQISADLKRVGRDVSQGQAPVFALVGVSALAVLREGAEVALFLYGVLASGKPWFDVLAGGSSGIVIGAVFGTLLYFGLIKIPSKHIFSVTGLLLIFLAAGMVSQAAGYLSF